MIWSQVMCNLTEECFLICCTPSGGSSRFEHEAGSLFYFFSMRTVYRSLSAVIDVPSLSLLVAIPPLHRRSLSCFSKVSGRLR